MNSRSTEADEPNPKPLLQLCQQHFPGLAWNGYETYANGEMGDINITIDVYTNGARTTIYINGNIFFQSPNKQGISPEQALAQAAAKWREFAAEADLVAGENQGNL